MVNFKHLAVVVVLLVGLAFSGCVGEDTEEKTPYEPSQEVNADEILAEESVGLTDAEIADIESEMDEMTALLEDIDSFESFSFEEI